MSGVCHIEENTKDVNGQQREDDCAYHTYDDLLKVSCYVFQGATMQACQPQAEGKGKDQCRHDIHQGWNGNREIG